MHVVISGNGSERFRTIPRSMYSYAASARPHHSAFDFDLHVSSTFLNCRFQCLPANLLLMQSPAGDESAKHWIAVVYLFRHCIRLFHYRDDGAGVMVE